MILESRCSMRWCRISRFCVCRTWSASTAVTTTRCATSRHPMLPSTHSRGSRHQSSQISEAFVVRLLHLLSRAQTKQTTRRAPDGGCLGMCSPCPVLYFSLGCVTTISRAKFSFNMAFNNDLIENQTKCQFGNGS